MFFCKTIIPRNPTTQASEQPRSGYERARRTNLGS
jgi:hypothetical protein